MLPEDYNDDETSTETKYEVYNSFGQKVGTFDSKTEAGEKADNYGGGYIETIEVEVESEDGGPEYGFVGQKLEESGSADDDQPTSRWGLGHHSTAPDETEDELDQLLDQLDDDVDGDLRDTLEEAAQMVGSASIGGFECAVCGLHHGHSDTKHDIRDPRNGFAVTDGFANEMEFSPFCHCGVNELAMLIEFYADINAQVFQDDERFATLKDLTSGELQAIMRERRDLNGTPGTGRMKRAAVLAGVDVREAVIEDLRNFHGKYEEIKRAANSAPIPGHVRSTIEDNREWLEGQL